MKFKYLAASALALAFFSSTQASAASVLIDFDNVVAGSTATSAAPAGISFHNAMFTNDVDAFGDEILHTEKWRIDTDNDAAFPVLIGDTLANDYGVAPSGKNALDVREQAVTMHFNSAVNLTSFQFTLDNSTYGNIGNSAAYFVDANKNILGTLLFDQTIPSAVISTLTNFANVQDIVFSSGAFYDNINFSTADAPVPLPAALPLLLSALGLLGGAVRRAKA